MSVIFRLAAVALTCSQTVILLFYTLSASDIRIRIRGSVIRITVAQSTIAIIRIATKIHTPNSEPPSFNARFKVSCPDQVVKVSLKTFDLIFKPFRRFAYRNHVRVTRNPPAIDVYVAVGA